MPKTPPGAGTDATVDAAPAIPSFASLRDPRRRTAVDVLVPGRPAPAPAPASTPAPAPVPVPPRRAAVVRPAPGVRPAEYADLRRFGVRVVGAAVVLPGRVALWSVREPVRVLRRLLGG
jgi:hypothetical protein